MNTVEQRRNERIRKLVSEPGPCITLAFPGGGRGEGTAEWKNALTAIRGELRNRGQESPTLLNPLIAAGPDVIHDINERRGVVILRSLALLEIHRLSSVAPLARVAEHFDIRTVLTLAGQVDLSFYILALSQKRTRILKCTADRAEEVPFPAGAPASLADAMQTRKPDHNLDNRASGGPSSGAGAIVFGTSSGHDDRDEYVLHFFRELDRAVNGVLKGLSDPLIAAGVEREIALYRRVNTYPNLVEPGIYGAPDGLEGGEMHRRALELLAEHAAQPGRELPPDFDKRVGTGRASTHLQEIIATAYQGRVSSLWFQSNARYLGSYDPVRQRVKHTDDPLDSPADLIEAAAYQTILQGGEVRVLPASAMPNGVPACALFRYPAVQNQSESEAIRAKG